MGPPAVTNAVRRVPKGAPSMLHRQAIGLEGQQSDLAAVWQHKGPIWGPFFFGNFWTLPTPHLRGPPRVYLGVRILKRACVGEETRNLARGLARRTFFTKTRVVKCCLVLACLSNLL